MNEKKPKERTGPHPLSQEPTVAIVVPTRSAELLELHLLSHELYTPADVPVVVVDTSPPGDDDVHDLALRDDEWQREIVYLDFRDGGAPDAVYSEEHPKAFYGNFVNEGIRACEEGFESFGGTPADDPAPVTRTVTHTIAPPELVVLANDDTVVFPDWLPTMIADFREIEATRDEKVGLLGARSNYVSGPQSVYDRTLLPWGVNGETVFAYPRVVTFFAMARLESLLAVGDPGEGRGGFDELLPAHNHSDDVLSLRFLRAGMLNWVSRTFIPHAGSQTFRMKGGAVHAADFYREDLARGEAYVLEHYGDAPALWGAVLERFYPSQGSPPSQGSHPSGAGVRARG